MEANPVELNERATNAEVVEVDVVLPANLHARPAGRLVGAAAEFPGQVEIKYRDKTANASSILAVMGLGATQGETVTVRAHGAGARHAADKIAELLRAAE